MYLKILLVSFLAWFPSLVDTEEQLREKARLKVMAELTEANILFSDKKYEDAHKDYQRILEKYGKAANTKLLDPDFLDDSLLHAKIGSMDSLARLKRVKEALALYPPLRSAKVSVHSHLLAAQTAMLNRDMEGCLDALNQAVALDKDAYYAHYMLGMISNGMRKYDEAIGHLKRSIAANDEYAEAYFLIGNIYLRKADKPNIKKYWGAYLKLVPTHGERYEFVKGTLLKMGGA